MVRFQTSSKYKDAAFDFEIWTDLPCVKRHMPDPSASDLQHILVQQSIFDILTISEH